jgi:UTP--glucose-1-phosphate uridylyltransferase
LQGDFLHNRAHHPARSDPPHNRTLETRPMKMNCLLSGSDSIPAMFRPFALKMEELGMPAIVINLFKCYYAQLLYGAQGKLSEKEILPVRENEVMKYETLSEYGQAGSEAMHQVVVIKLNGGLGTTMGLERAKSLIPVKDGLSFLEIILLQMRRLREKHRTELPLVLMNSFKTHLETMLEIEGFDNGSTGIPLAFVQHRYPKILEKDLSPARWPRNPELEWNPPGHGDIYTAMVTSGLLDKLLDRGYRYAFISNSDNLGAVMDEAILGCMVREHIPFLMEVAQRTPSDRKGGHLTKLLKNGRFALREIAQCPDPELSTFSDISKHRFFNTNSIWLDLKAFEKVFLTHLMMPLDVIINNKTVDPRQSDSPKVIQIETAMGSAITSFDRAGVVLVPRQRFAPVKSTNDLMLVMSDCYARSSEETIIPNPLCSEPLPEISLDQSFYGNIDNFLARFPEGVPSLLSCNELSVRGDVLFGADVRLIGKVSIRNRYDRQARIENGSTLEGEVTF